MRPHRRGEAVALTAYAAITGRTRALLEGFSAHATKPTEPQELVAVVASLARGIGARRDAS